MKAVILAGGKGTRISEETKLRPKPMVEIGGRPILWHIMKHYSKYGISEFIVCCGYKGHMIKEYFVNYYANNNDIKVHLDSKEEFVKKKAQEPWKVTLVDTGLETLTSGRILKIRDYVGNEPFMLTYGDGVSDINIDSLLKWHKNQGKIVTISATQPEGRFGTLKLGEINKVLGFKEKSRAEQSWVNMGFMVMQPEVFSFLGDGSAMLETEPFEKLVKAGEMAAYKHMGYWHPMDNVHDRDYLEAQWRQREGVFRDQ